MKADLFIAFILCTLFYHVQLINWTFAFDDELEPDSHNVIHDTSKPLPKDKVLLSDIKTLTFYRNKRTTSRRTHSIHQLSCVGGTAGCKLFTPNEVHCDNLGYHTGKKRFDWRCRADVSDRVTFNHVEVICEGYDYPEDDYILLGSCGLEFTLDYKDPYDHHHQSYFKHMDEDEKKMHHERVRQKTGIEPPSSYIGYIQDSVSAMSLNVVISVFVLMCFLALVSYYFRKTNESSIGSNRKRPFQRASNYGPLTTAVLTTKKAC